MREDNLMQYTAYVGLDWADVKHDVSVQSGERNFSVIDHNPVALDKWVRELRRRFGGLIAVAAELSKGPIVSALRRYDFIVIFPINPSTLAKYREAFQPSRAKDDPADAELAVDLLVRHQHRFKPLRPQSAEIRALATMVEHRREQGSDRIRVTNRLRATLKQYYPHILEWFDHIDTPLFCSFFRLWPSLIQARRARTSTLKRFFHEHHMYREAVIERRITAIKRSVSLTEDDAIIAPYRLNAEILVGQLELALANRCALRRVQISEESGAQRVAVNYPAI